MDLPEAEGAAGAGQPVAVSYSPATAEGFVEDKHQQQGRADDNKPDYEKHDPRSPPCGRRPTSVRLSLLRCHLRSSGWTSDLRHIWPLLRLRPRFAADRLTCDGSSPDGLTWVNGSF
jgi:hypothetical protein